MLEHPDPALSLTLYRAADGTDIVAEWQSWGRVLGVPLLVAEADGRLREPFERIGGVARRTADRAPATTLGAEAAPAGAAVAPADRHAAGNTARASRRARDHRAELAPND